MKTLLELERIVTTDGRRSPPLNRPLPRRERRKRKRERTRQTKRATDSSHIQTRQRGKILMGF